MQVTSLSIQLLMGVLVLMAAQIDHRNFAQKDDFPHISPDRQQFYEYETVSISCEELSGAAEWRVMQKLHKKIPPNSSDCSVPAPSCTIDVAFESHSGEYWCENMEGNTSRTINITVTAGSVILKVPASPVVEGIDVILYCRNQKSQSKHTADLFKNGVHLGTMYGGNMTIKNVSKSHEGFYMCRISEGEESQESWLSVSKRSNNSIDKIQPPNRPSTNLQSLLWIVVGVSTVVTLLLAMGLFLCRKHKVQREGNVSDQEEVTYADVKHPRRNMVSGGEDAVDPNNVTYAQVESQRKKKDQNKSRARENPSSSEDGITYSSIKTKPSAQN